MKLNILAAFLFSLASVQAECAEPLSFFGTEEAGYCVTSSGGDQNSGVVKLYGGDVGNTQETKDSCLEACSCYAGARATGCEMIWNRPNKGCYVHTQEIARGNDYVRHLCYIAVAAPETFGSGGDPHITTWANEHFEYHGQCDLTLVKDAEFADGLGLDIQIRTKIVRYWSYIKNVAIKIGNDILEIEGSPDADDAEAHYWVNFESQGELDTFAGFPVTQKLPSVYKRQYTIDLSSKYPGKSIVVELYKEFVRVRFNGDIQTFGNTVGLMGDFKTGKTLARDGITVMNDFTEFGDEWQVLPSEPKLFHEVAQPQFPELCVKPEDSRGDRKRRLAESNISIEEAEAACAQLKDPLSIKDCVYDILATQDMGMVGAF